ncbi:uncharacterized protein LOC109503872 isoform X2 [Harpegnathos saltator]|uniref:uncharacterized protein LOC109503872 isoform X2 n=1 Tax=Harpegnathos saltator TaxID=610380 RepID=UPI000948D885|nr:uncharacterized protein LOC109503872 isoform X2 [Harpegnathos saltator]
MLSFWPTILDIVLPANESRPHPQLQIMTEYFIDPEKYFFFILLHANAAYCIGGLVMLAIGTMNIAYIQLICGIFKISSYRMEQIMMICTVNNAGNQNLIHKGIVYAVKMHRRAMRFIKVYISKMEVPFFLIIVAGVISSSLNLFRLFQEISVGFDLRKMILPTIFLYIFYIYVILANNCAQQIMDHNDHVFATVYNIEWYEAPLTIQKMILFMLQKGNKPFLVNLGGVFTASLESAAKLMSTSMSYFTVLYSTQ